MKNHFALPHLLLLALACTSVHCTWVYKKGDPYFSVATIRGISTPEARTTPPTVIPARANRPLKTSPDGDNLFPDAPGALCSDDQMKKIKVAWDTAVRFLHLTSRRHERQMDQWNIFFTPNVPFQNFVAPDNYYVLGAPSTGPKTLHASLSQMFTNMKTRFATPRTSAGKDPAMYVTCYKHYWTRETPEAEYQDGCVNGNAFAEKQDFETASGPMSLEMLNFCPLFFANPTWANVLEATTGSTTREASVDYARDCQVTIILHEWSHAAGVMWQNAEDLTYGVNNCRRLASEHAQLTLEKQSQYSARHSPGNADSEALYIMSLAMDATPSIRKLYGNPLNRLRQSAADPDGSAGAQEGAIPDGGVHQDLYSYFKQQWNGMVWPTSPPVSPVLAPTGGSPKSGSPKSGSPKSGSPTGAPPRSGSPSQVSALRPGALTLPLRPRPGSPGPASPAGRPPR